LSGKADSRGENHFLEVNHSVALISPLSIAPGGHATSRSACPKGVAVDVMFTGGATESSKRSASDPVDSHKAYTSRLFPPW
jgi:hypothetical protein